MLKNKRLKPKQVSHLYDTGENTLKDEIVEIRNAGKDGRVIGQYSVVIPLFNPLTLYQMTFLDRTKLKAFADDELYVARMIISVS